MGTTVSGDPPVGDQLAIAHIGDSRIYRCRDGELEPDHHRPHVRAAPRRQRPHHRRGGGGAPAPLGAHARARRRRRGPRDRHRRARHPRRRPLAALLRRPRAVVSFDEDKIADARPTSAPRRSPTAWSKRASTHGGAPDNVTVVIVDIGDRRQPATPPLVVGSAAAPLAFGSAAEPVRARGIRLPTLRPHPVQETHFEPESADYLDELIEEDAPPSPTPTLGRGLLDRAARRRDRRRRSCSATSGRSRTTSSASPTARVAIYQGVQQDIGPISLHELYTETTIDVADLRPTTSSASSRPSARTSFATPSSIVQRLEDCRLSDRDRPHRRGAPVRRAAHELGAIRIAHPRRSSATSSCAAASSRASSTRRRSCSCSSARWDASTRSCCCSAPVCRRSSSALHVALRFVARDADPFLLPIADRAQRARHRDDLPHRHRRRR